MKVSVAFSLVSNMFLHTFILPNWNVSPVSETAEFHVLRYKVSGPRGA